MTDSVRTFFDRWAASVNVGQLVTDVLRAEHAYYRAKDYELHHEPGIGLVWERSPFLYRFDAPSTP